MHEVAREAGIDTNTSAKIMYCLNNVEYLFKTITLAKFVLFSAYYKLLFNKYTVIKIC